MERGLEHIDQVDTFLLTWAGGLLDGATVSLAAPGSSDEEATVSLYLLEIRPRPPARGRGPAPLRFTLRYLVSAWATSMAEAHHHIGSLAFAVLEDEQLEFDPAVPPGLWRDLGVPPRVGFVLGIDVTRQRTQPTAPLVEHPMQIIDSGASALTGRIVTMEQDPVPGVTVEMADSGRHARTSSDGRFRLPWAAAEGHDLRLRVQAKGRTCTVSTNERGDGEVPLDFESFSLVLRYAHEGSGDGDRHANERRGGG